MPSSIREETSRAHRLMSGSCGGRGGGSESRLRGRGQSHSCGEGVRVTAAGGGGIRVSQADDKLLTLRLEGTRRLG